MNFARMVSVLVVVVATVMVALGIFDALSWDEIKNSLGKVVLLGVVMVVASVLISLISGRIDE